MPALPSHSLRRARPWLGTLVDITLQGEDGALLAVTMEDCFAAIERVHRLMSFHEAASDVSRLNRETALRPVRVATEVIQVLEIARRVSAQSDGLFDITVADQLVACGHLPAIHTVESTALPAVGASWDDVVLSADEHVIFRRPLLIDLGGIAKGFAVDQALRICKQAGARLRAARINAGGDLARFGQTDAAIQIRHPVDASSLLSIDCGDHVAVATSAYEHAKPTHILPAGFSGTPRVASVTVMASSCVIADALTKVVMLDATGDIAARCLKNFEASAIVIDPQGNIHRSSTSPAKNQSQKMSPAYA